MPSWRDDVQQRLQAAGLPPAREADVLDELTQHLEDRERELRREGRSADEARRLVLDEIADERWLRTELRRLRFPLSDAVPADAGAGLLDRLRMDLRYAVRTLVANRGFTLAAVLALGLGIGANAAIFGAVDAVLLRPLPYPHADRLVVPVSVNARRNVTNGSVAYADLTDWRTFTDAFAAVALYRPTNVDLTSGVGGDPERIEIAQVSEDFFRVMDITPALGRTLAPGDFAPGAPRAVVISARLWQRHFGGATDVVGRTVHIAGVPVQIAGVAPNHGVWPESSDLFIADPPRNFGQDVLTRRDNQIFEAVARLADDVPIDRAIARVAGNAARVAHDHPESRADWSNTVVPLRQYLVSDDLRRALLVLLAAVGAVLLIACANVANLALVRGSGRAREFAVRLSLGASRRRLIQQLSVESIVLTLTGAAAGLALAPLIMRGLVAMAPAGTPFVDQIRLDWRVGAATLLASAGAALLSGILPALATSTITLAPALRDGTAGAGTSRRANRLRGALVAAEIAIAVVLVTDAGLLIRSFARLSHVDSGISLADTLGGRLSIPTSRYRDGAARARFVQTLVDRLDADPDVASAAATSFIPVGGGGFGLGRVFLAEGQADPPASADVSAQWNVITPAYFKTLGIRLREGRPFDTHDTVASTPVIIVSDSFARAMFPGQSALGKRIRSWRDENVLRQIVGVVDDVKYESLGDVTERLIYVPHTQDSWGAMGIVLRAKYGNPDALAPVLRRTVASIDPELAVAGVRSLADTASASIANERYSTLLLAVLAAVALVLSGLGVYGVTSYVFTLRRREMGIRLALGASRANLYGLVFRHTLTLAAVGLAIGVAIAAASARLLATLLYETPTTDAAAWGSMIGVVLLAAACACLLPAHRAAHADPTGALRAD
jgi:predicted permease